MITESLTAKSNHVVRPTPDQVICQGKHGNLKLKHGSSDDSFERAHLVELNAANRISKGLSNQKWRVVLRTHCEVHYALPFLTGSGKHGNLKLKHGSSDNSFERAHLVELNAANRISKGLSNQKWRIVLGTHCEVHYALPFLTGSSYSDAVGSVSLYYPMRTRNLDSASLSDVLGVNILAHLMAIKRQRLVRADPLRPRLLQLALHQGSRDENGS
ncbi:hypothetical protein J6590_041694 [Homalodisca vitripennis]|nr:hypothetical protein J6590_041694 [Homalodisca vitripennis]